MITHLKMHAPRFQLQDTYELKVLLCRFNMEARSTVAALFNTWAKKPAFQDPKRLLSKVNRQLCMMIPL